jgi:SSS family solute:Na+ symporter
MIFLMVSTDCSYLLSWGAILIQDLVLPLRKRAFTPRQQLLWLRLAVIAVAVYAFLFSLNFGQVTYILMFFALTGSVYMGGAGAVILGGLYWRRGTAAGAWAAMLTGAGLAVLGFIGMNYWVGTIYPAIAQSPELLAWLSNVVAAISSPFEPIILWRVTPDKFFINGQEIYFLTMISAILAYVVVSLLTCREKFNMERMLHRGQYARADEGLVQADPGANSTAPWWKRIFLTLSGIDEQFSRGDKVLSISVMVYSLGWGFGSWLVIVVWNAISPWPAAWWVNWFFIANIIVASIIGLVSTVWFSIGGTLDLLAMFRRLKVHRADVHDDGRVIGHANAEDVEK